MKIYFTNYNQNPIFLVLIQEYKFPYRSLEKNTKTKNTKGTRNPNVDGVRNSFFKSSQKERK